MNRSLFLAALGAAIATARSQTPSSLPPPAALDRLVVSANGIPQDPATVPQDVTVLLPVQLDADQVPDLRTALAAVPGAVVAGSGARGAQTAVFLRGANSDQTLFVVDGVRLNTAADAYANFLGAAALDGLDRVEVLLGPQSTVYGSSAAGGVIRLDTAYGTETPAQALTLAAGSFRTYEGSVSAAGSGTKGLGYSVSAGHLQTDNDRPDNRFTDWTYSTRVEDRISPWLLAGVTLRGVASHYEEPGPTPTDFPDPGVVTADTTLGTAYVEVAPSAAWKARVTAGWFQDQYAFDDGFSFDFFQYRNTRSVLEAQTTWTPIQAVQVVAGFDGEWNRYWSGPQQSDRLAAGYVLTTWSPSPGVDFSGGLRRDAYSVEGGATTGRVGGAWRPGNGPTKLRATYGSAFEAPTPSDRFGSPPYVLPNPGVRPERSHGWDAGVDETIAFAQTTLSATVFATRYSDLLEYEVEDFTTFAGAEINVDRAVTRGFEWSAQSQPATMIRTRFAYTYLSAIDETNATRLRRRPRHGLDGSADFWPEGAFSAGAGVHLVADDYDGLAAAGPFGGYVTVRVFARYRVNRKLTLTARAENLLNRRYEEVAGYPALPRAVFGGIEWRH